MKTTIQQLKTHVSVRSFQGIPLSQAEKTTYYRLLVVAHRRILFKRFRLLTFQMLPYVLNWRLLPIVLLM